MVERQILNQWVMGLNPPVFDKESSDIGLISVTYLLFISNFSSITLSPIAAKFLFKDP